jgi:hypothetical protein
LFSFLWYIRWIVNVYSRFVLIFRKPHNEYFLSYDIITRIYMQAVNFIFCFININYSVVFFRTSLWFFVSFRIFLSDNTRVILFIFFCRAKRKFFSQNLTLGYMTETLNQIIFFFLHQNQNIYPPTSCYMVVPLAHVVLIGGKPWEHFVYFALCLVVIFLQSAVEKSNRLLRMYTNSQFTPSLLLKIRIFFFRKKP